jgi:hypothetical protein
VIKAQDEAAGELIIFVKNNPGGAEIKIEVQLVSSLCWDAWLSYPNVHDITNLYNGSHLTTSSTLTVDLNWEAYWSSPGYQYGFGLGNYRVTAYQKINGKFEQKDYFYIDYRTSDLPENFNSGGQGDLRVDFNVGSGVFYYKDTQNLFPTTTSIWEQKSWIDSITNELEPLPPDDFSLSSSGGHPYLTWSHSYDTGDYWTGYCIYRSVVSGCGSGAGSFTKIATRTQQITSYTDNSLTVNGPMTAHYKITAINGERESDFTETLDICVGLNKENASEQRYDNGLSQNYPNPFNPRTKISFSLKEKAYVLLRVFDILGREVALLVNEELNSGNHTIEFDGQNLESGIYFYEIRANEFSEVKKLILLK